MHSFWGSFGWRRSGDWRLPQPDEVLGTDEHIDEVQQSFDLKLQAR
jgi:hypothetical protein